MKNDYNHFNSPYIGVGVRYVSSFDIKMWNAFR
jgi:outer membrane protein W